MRQYLGVHLTNTGTYKRAQDNLCTKGSRARFKLKFLMANTGLPKKILKLFDQIFKPVALYGCEIWRTENIMFCWYIVNV